MAFVNKPEPSKYEIIQYTNYTKEPLVIKRLIDGQTFRLGDTIERVTPMGKVQDKVILYNIQVEKDGFMQMHCYTIGSNGTATIQNEKYAYTGDNCNLFNYIKNVTQP